MLTRREPANLLALVGEAAIRQEIGGRDVVLDQMHHLLNYAQMPTVDLRIVSSTAGWSPALEGPFVLIDFDDERPIVHVENRRAGLFFHEPDDIEAYRNAVDRVKSVAMSPADTTKLIADVITELETTT